MKNLGKITIALLLAALMLSTAVVPAFAAEGGSSSPTVGPAEDSFLYGGARLGIYNTHTNINSYVVNHDYSKVRGIVIDNDAVPGMTYDRSTNTLTIEDIKQSDNELFIWYMGNDFKLNVKGENEFAVIFVYNSLGFYNTSLNIVGDGTLTVNEKRVYDVAIKMESEGDAPIMGLDIADTVTVNLYSKNGEAGNDPYPVVGLSATATAPAQGGAITVGGKTAAEAQSKQIVLQEPQTVPVIDVTDRDKDYPHGSKLKSKSDPNGVYTLVEIMDDVVYLVQHYTYVSDLNMWVVDHDFSDVGFLGKRYTKEEFEEAYDYVYGMAPTKLKFMEAYKVDWRGSEGVKLSKDGDEAVYLGEPTGIDWDWGDYENYRGNYHIIRAAWDDRQEIYVEDTSFRPIDLDVSELEGEGYHFVQETVTEPLELTVWTSSDPSDTSRFELTNSVLNRSSDPDGLYIQVGTYSSGDSETGISIHKVHYNPETEEHYIEYNSYSSSEYFLASDADIASGDSEFSYATDTRTRYVTARYLPHDYKIDWDLIDAVQLKKTGEPDTVYAYKQWKHFSQGTEREVYAIIKLTYNENFGCYIEDTSFEEYEFDDLDFLSYMGYQIVKTNQPIDFTTKGNISLLEYPVYTDNSGNRYFVDYRDNVYSFNDSDIITLGGIDYYYGQLKPELSTEDLNDTLTEIVTDTYSYWIEGAEYHHVGGQMEYVEYPLWVNGEQFNSDRLIIPCGKGTAVYSPSANTLTLNNAEITRGTDKDWTYSGVLSQLEHLTVVIKGDCTITETGGDGIGTYNSESYQIGDVIYPAPYDLTICGDGTLTIVESTAIYGYGLYCTGDLILKDISLHVESAAAGVWASDLEMNGVTADIRTSSWYSGIVINRGDFDFDNSDVTAQSAEGAGLLLGNDVDSSALNVNSGTLSLTGKIGVQGVVDKSIVAVNGGRLSVEGADAAFDETYLADNAKNIVMGEGIGVILGDLNGKAVVISEMTAPILGDADGDLSVTVMDATFTQRWLEHLPMAVTYHEDAADVDGNGSIEIIDATYILRYTEQIPTPYGIGEAI